MYHKFTTVAAGELTMKWSPLLWSVAPISCPDFRSILAATPRPGVSLTCAVAVGNTGGMLS